MYDISLGSKEPRQVICTSCEKYMLHKCKHARQENAANDIIFNKNFKKISKKINNMMEFMIGVFLKWYLVKERIIL